ncbi:hypothetical protein Belba_3837 [Belliella baltica DSM 15883]|uniref:Uncharacterized protein n=1 Tax=Belliella baltica (strain DSM 15883 / CIP 108006 / LMG 21964 / BA134) TaxID=866536 RepID=I3ZAP9_BELBD|nr:hypothetical protein [Belliella baltica]AFL86317.1 hypothetical protein Belba_3837 [Belliella baltica DSM 15883]
MNNRKILAFTNRALFKYPSYNQYFEIIFFDTLVFDYLLSMKEIVDNRNHSNGRW